MSTPKKDHKKSENKLASEIELALHAIVKGTENKKLEKKIKKYSAELAHLVEKAKSNVEKKKAKPVKKKKVVKKSSKPTKPLAKAKK